MKYLLRSLTGVEFSMKKELKLCILIVAALLAGCQTSQKNIDFDDSSEENNGIEVECIQLSAAGYMLDFRYRVVDPVKAYDLLQREAETYLIDEKTNAKLIVPTPPKVGALRQKTKTPEAGRVYFVMFANPGNLVKKGDKVTVVIDDFKAENMTVY